MLNQNNLIQKTEHLRSALTKSADKLVCVNKDETPDALKTMFDEVLFNIDSIDCIIYRAKRKDSLKICDDIIKGITKQVNEFSFFVALYNSKSYEA